MSKLLSRQEIIDGMLIQYGVSEFSNGVPMRKRQYEAYRSLGYGDGRTWDDIITSQCPHLASEEAFNAFYGREEAENL